MKIKILSIVAGLFTMTAVAANEFQYLYWMVDLPQDSEYEFDYATVRVGDDRFEIYDPYTQQSTGVAEVSADNTGLSTGYGVYVGDVSSYVGSTFLFELWDDDDEKVAWVRVSGSSLANYIGGTMSQISTPYVVSTNLIPEPTSGLLLLIGLAGLALKRKRG